MAMSSSARSSVATIGARAPPDEDFKACCMRAGHHDGANRNDYFQGVASRPAMAHPPSCHGRASSRPSR
jgi:hypothetical protein